MPNLPGYRVDEETGIKYLLWGDSQYAYEPPTECPMPKTEQLSKYLLDVFVALNTAEMEIGYDPAHPMPLNEVNDNLDGVIAVIGDVRDAMSSISSISDTLGGVIEEISLVKLQIETSIESVLSIKIDSLIEQLTLLQVDFNAVKLQIDRLYIDKINIEGGSYDDSALRSILKKALLFGAELDKSILDLALIRPKIEGEVLRTVENMVSHIEQISEDLVSLEMVDDVLELGPTAVYCQSKVVRD